MWNLYFNPRVTLVMFTPRLFPTRNKRGHTDPHTSEKLSWHWPLTSVELIADTLLICTWDIDIDMLFWFHIFWSSDCRAWILSKSPSLIAYFSFYPSSTRSDWKWAKLKRPPRHRDLLKMAINLQSKQLEKRKFSRMGVGQYGPWSTKSSNLFDTIVSLPPKILKIISMQ